jgi:hypothetical protein
VAGAAGLLSPRRGWAEEPALKTASVRFGKARTTTPPGGNTAPRHIRFYALRLHEAGMIKGSPQKIIADGTDWRFLNEAQTRAEGVSTR